MGYRFIIFSKTGPEVKATCTLNLFENIFVKTEYYLYNIHVSCMNMVVAGESVLLYKKWGKRNMQLIYLKFTIYS